MQICLSLKHFLEIDELKTLINSFILSNFNYCPRSKSLRKIEKTQKKKSRLMINNYLNTSKHPLKKTVKPKVTLR